MTEIFFEVTEDEVDGGICRGRGSSGCTSCATRFSWREVARQGAALRCERRFDAWAATPCDSEAPTCGSRRRSTVNIMR